MSAGLDSNSVQNRLILDQIYQSVVKNALVEEIQHEENLNFGTKPWVNITNLIRFK